MTIKQLIDHLVKFAESHPDTPIEIMEWDEDNQDRVRCELDSVSIVLSADGPAVVRLTPGSSL